MATQSDVRRIATALPDVEEARDRFAFSVLVNGKAKGFAWVWMERVTPKKPRVPNPSVLAVRVANVGARDALISAEPVKFFTEPHYAGFPAVLVRLAEVSVSDMRELLRGAWLTQAPPALAESLTRSRGSAAPKRRGSASR